MRTMLLWCSLCLSLQFAFPDDARFLLADGKIVREAQIMQAKTPDDSPAWPPEELVPGFK